MAVYKVSNSGYLPFIEKGQFEPEFTEIENRAPVDSSLKTVFGNERVHVNSLRKLTKEFGPNGEPVFEADSGDSRIRFVGDWETVFLGALGMYARNVSTDPTDTDSFCEITFYGTGLNLFTVGNNDRAFEITIDGASQPNLTFNNSDVLLSRNYKNFSKYNVVSGLSLGWHTIKINNQGGGSFGMDFYGFEILNESTDMTVVSGVAHGNGYKYPIENDQTLSYNTGFENIADGNIGSKGGRVIVYIDPKDGLIKKRFTKVDDTAQYVGSTDHTNEAVYRKINWREFGRNRGDDFSTLGATDSDARAFTLDDGTTTLIGGGPSASNGIDAPAELLRLLSTGGVGGFITFTFVGTGLDLIMVGSGGDDNEIFVNGVSQGRMNADQGEHLFKVCSGLPYGTHTVKIERQAASFASNQIRDFIVYQPKKPSLPKSAVVLADYNILSNFTQLTTGSSSRELVSDGVIRKDSSRELIYSGTWGSTTLNPNVIGFFMPTTTTNGSYFEYTFFGTGFDFRAVASTDRSDSVLVELNDVILNTTNYPSINGNTNVSGFQSFNETTGVLDMDDGVQVNNSSFAVTNLPLGLYTVRFTNQTTDILNVESIDIITPIHSPNTTFGSLSLKDCRNFDSSKDVNKDIKGGTKVLASFTSVDNTIGQSKNVSQILDGGTGIFDVYFEDVFVDEDYIDVVSNAENQRDTITQLQRINSVRVLGRDGDSATTVDPGRVSLTIDGKLQKDELEE